MLDLRFDGTLADAGPNAASVTMQKGAAAYGTGIRGQAFKFNGSNAIRLGTAAYLQPQDLTVSFWYKPNAAMTGEQVFAWSKTAYNSDGWYLTSESDTSPLALSIGPSTGQPYKVAVDTPARDFFPAGQWTHVVVTYDKATKAVTFYRNGVPPDLHRQVRRDAAPRRACSAPRARRSRRSATTARTYNGAHVNGLLDDYTLYNGVATIADVVTLTQQDNPAFDPADRRAAAPSTRSTVPASAAADFGAADRSARTAPRSRGTSSDTDVISIDGGEAHVTRPDPRRGHRDTHAPRRPTAGAPR